jgi:hypothetical protein
VNLFEMKSVPLIEGFMFDYKTIEELLIASKGLYKGTQNRREGIVIRPTVERYSTVLKGRMSFKVVDNEYLLKDED